MKSRLHFPNYRFRSPADRIRTRIKFHEDIEIIRLNIRANRERRRLNLQRHLLRWRLKRRLRKLERHWQAEPLGAAFMTGLSEAIRNAEPSVKALFAELDKKP